MDILFTVSKKESARILKPLLRACSRSNCTFEVFLTHQGVLILDDGEIETLLATASVKTVACHHSWTTHADSGDCPVTLGSQTNHSEMLARSKRVVSL